jgi:hypothetical protein
MVPQTLAEAVVPGVQSMADFRQLMVMEWLQQCRARSEVVSYAMLQWGISRRTAQCYVQEAIRRLSGESATEPRGYFLRMSQLQRERLLQQVLAAAEGRKEMDTAGIKALARLVEAGCKLLDSRDRTTDALLEWHEELVREERQEKQGEAPATPAATQPALPEPTVPALPAAEGQLSPELQAAVQAVLAQAQQLVPDEELDPAALDDMTAEEIRAGMTPEELEEADLLDELEPEESFTESADRERVLGQGPGILQQEAERKKRREQRDAALAQTLRGMTSHPKSLADQKKGHEPAAFDWDAAVAQACAFLRGTARPEVPLGTKKEKTADRSLNPLAGVAI